MSLEELEHKLFVIHSKGLIMPVTHNLRGLTAPSIRKIVSGGNYQIESLLDYIWSLGLVPSLNDEVLVSAESLGFALVEVRKSKGIKQKTLLAAIKEDTPSFTHSRICACEKGRNYERKTLMAYLTGLEKCCGVTMEWDLAPGNVHLSYADIKNL